MDPFRQFLFDFCCFEILPHTEAQASWNYVAQAVFKIMTILLPQPPKFWDYTENIEVYHHAWLSFQIFIGIMHTRTQT